MLPATVEMRARAWLNRSGEWEYRGRAWPHGDTTLRGWDSSAVAASQASKWHALAASAQGAYPLGMSLESRAPSNADYGTHNTVMAFAYVAGLAALGKAAISILDWGGGLGYYGLLARSLYPNLTIDYHVRELPAFAAAGRQLNRAATFHDSDEAALVRTYDLVVASSSLQYSENWRNVLHGLARATAGYLYVTRQPFVQSAGSFVVVQRPYGHGYDTEYPGWFLNRTEFLAAAKSVGMTLVREFLVQEQPFVPGAPEQADYRGFLFEPREAT
jgi:putative methyltransferase (TIGR04325 family)